MTPGSPDEASSGELFGLMKKLWIFLKKGVDKWGSGVYNTSRR